MEHLIFVFKVMVDLLAGQSLALLLQKFDQLVSLFDLDFGLGVSIVVLFFTDEGHSHLVDLGLLLEGQLIGGEVIFNGLVVLAPREDIAHGRVLVSQVLFLAVKSFVVSQLIELGGQNLVLDLGSFDIGFARVFGLDLLEALPGHYFVYLFSLLLAFGQALASNSS